MTNTLQALRIDPDGTAHAVTLTQSEDGSTLRSLQAQVGGFIDVVSLAEDLDMWVNDEGLVLGLSLNPVGSVIAAGYGARQPYVGPVVFTGGPDNEGSTQSLTPSMMIHLQGIITALGEGA